MYDFFLGAFPKTFAEESKYLISVKRMLPRWCNSIPDVEFLCIAKLADQLGKEAVQKQERPFFVETGVGASTLALMFYAQKYNGNALTWDTNAEKASEIRRCANETIGNSSERDLNRHWKLIHAFSTSKYLGLPVLESWTKQVHLSLHDSEHTWNTLGGEVQAVLPYLKEGSVVAMDDASYEFLHTDEIYLNIQRKKLGLQPVAPIEGNRTEFHWKKVEGLLAQTWQKVEPLNLDVGTDFQSDISISYFSNDVEVRRGLGMTDNHQIQKRFVAWKLGRG